MSDAAETMALSLDDVLKLVSSARSGTTDPISTGIAILERLGENVILSGDILRQALSQASLSLEGPLNAVLVAIGNITKTASRITFANSQELRPAIHGTTLRLRQTVTFEVSLDGGNPSLSNITGVAVHKVFWIDIQQIQLRQQAGQKIVHV